MYLTYFLDVPKMFQSYDNYKKSHKVNGKLPQY